jgi:hypothetical protein
MSMVNRISFGWREEFGDEHDPDVIVRAYLPSGWDLTVLSRRTGYGHRDVETGLRCNGTGRFWLASGHCDIREVLCLMDSEDEVIAWVKGNANNCRGESFRYPHLTHEQLMKREGAHAQP